MNETPKEPNAGNGDDAPTRRDGSPSQDDAAPVEAQWDEIPDAAKDQDETVEDAVDDLPVMTAATEEEAAAAEAAESERATRAEAAAATAAAAVGAAAAVSGPAGQDRQPAAAAPPAGGPGVLLLCWLGVLTLGVLFVLYLLVGDPAGLRDRLALAEAPEIQAAKAASDKAAANAAAIAALEGKVAAPADSPAVTALRERVAGVEDELARLSTRLSETVAALETARAEAGAAPAAPGGEAAAMATEVSERVDALAADVSKRIDALASELSGRIDTLQKSFAAADERIAALESRAEKASGRALATTMLALDDLRLGVVSGQPFEKLLERAQKAAPDAVELREGAWVPFADKGLPTDDELLADMQAISVSIGQDRLKDTLSSGESWLDRAVGGVVERLKVRRVGADVAGDDPSAVAARAEAALVEGDTEKAIAEVEALEGDAAARFQDWLAGAKALVAAHSDIDAVEQAAIAAADGA